MNKNPDKDDYNDLEEYQNGTDPYTYDLDALDYFVGFLEGFCFGDAAESNNAAVVFGQITSGFIPIWADSRDVAANLENGEWGYSLISAVGLVPLAGDVAKIAGTVADFIKHSDNIPEIIKVIDKVGETIPGIAKHLPSSAFDKIVDLLKNGQPISKAEYSKLKEVFAASGKNLDELVEIPFKYTDEISSGISKIAGKYKNLECVECADDIMNFLKKFGLEGELKELDISKLEKVNQKYTKIWSDNVGTYISDNGKHVGVLFNGKIYDNIHVNGINLDEWLSDMVISYGNGSVDLLQLYKAGILQFK